MTMRIEDYTVHLNTSSQLTNATARVQWDYNPLQGVLIQYFIFKESDQNLLGPRFGSANFQEDTLNPSEADELYGNESLHLFNTCAR